MSFGYAVGDVIAVLGLFERVAVELRNYKNAPARFQQLGTEIDLLRSTLRQVFALNPQDEAERKTIERVRLIAMHCIQPLQELAGKMQRKESSLGHFRSSKSLSHIGTRLHWSMIAEKDVDELRKVVLSEMVAINMILNAQQLYNIRALSLKIEHGQTADAALTGQHTDAVLQSTSKILDIVSMTPGAILRLQDATVQHNKLLATQSKALSEGLANIKTAAATIERHTQSSSAVVQRHITSITQAVTRLSALLHDVKKVFAMLAACSKEMLEAIGRNTLLLLDIANHMKRVVRAIEAIPLHLTLDLLRLDDALGESWALPMQACRTWESFCDILRMVVYANGRPGASHVATQRFMITMANTGSKLVSENWEGMVKSGVHIEQAMVVSGISTESEDLCPYPGCTGTIPTSEIEIGGRVCSKCHRSTARITPPREPTIRLYSQLTYSGPEAPQPTSQPNSGPELPPIQLDSELEHFRRVVTYRKHGSPISTIDDALDRLELDPSDVPALLYTAASQLCVWEHERRVDDAYLIPASDLDYTIESLRRVISREPDNKESWYLLARGFDFSDNFQEFHAVLQQGIYRDGRCPDLWISVGVLFYKTKKYRDSLDAISRAIRLNPYLWVPWFNLGVLYDACNRQSRDAADAYQRCLELNPSLADVRARLSLINSSLDSVLDASGEQAGDVPDDHIIKTMRHCQISMNGINSEAMDQNDVSISFAPIRDSELEWTTDDEESADGEE